MALDAQSGESVSTGGQASLGAFRNGDIYGKGRDVKEARDPGFGDVGGASRFFYVAKPSRAERDTGHHGVENKLLNTSMIVYADPLWVDAVLAQMLLVDTDTSRRKATVESTIQCSDGSAWSMCWCGSPSTDPFHPVVMSIIETKTRSTTPSRISNSFQKPHTNGCMAAAFGVTADGGNLAAYAEFQSPWKSRTGIFQKRDGLFTGDVNLATSIASWLKSEPVGGGRGVEARNFHPT